MEKIKTIQQFKRGLLYAWLILSFTLGVASCYAGAITGAGAFLSAGTVCFASFLVPSFLAAAFWAVENQVNKGPRYAWKQYRLRLGLRRQLLEAGIYITKSFGSVKLAEVPWVTVWFAPGFQHGTVYIENCIRFHDKLSRIDISPSLGGYVVEQAYLSDDENHYCYDFYDSTLERRQAFKSFQEFKGYSDSLGQYELFIDRYTKLPLIHQLLAGQTGSGKTYALHGYILQMRSKQAGYRLFFADPKSSSVALLGGRISPDTTAESFEGIVALLDAFVSEMGRRKAQLKGYLINKIDGDYRDFGLPPYVFIFDEYADFSHQLQEKEKKLRDHVNSLVSQVILKGRQLGFFMWMVMQQSGSNSIPTFIRDNLPWKVVLGNAEDQTYTTAFGAGAEIPLRKMAAGEGVFTYPAVANKPKLCSFPTLEFDILEALDSLPDVSGERELG